MLLHHSSLLFIEVMLTRNGRARDALDLLRHQSSRTMKQPSAPLFAGAPAYGGQPVQGAVIQGAPAYGGQPVQGAVIQGQPVVVQPQVIQGAVVQGSVVQPPQMVPNQYVVQQPQVVNPASVQIHGVAGVQSVAPPLGPRQPFQSGTFDCFDDFLGCCCVFWFQPCVVCCEGEQCGVGAELGLRETHVGLGPFCVVCLSNLSIYGFPICCNALCDCPCGKKYVWCCWYSAVLDQTVQRYNLVYPGPCYDSTCGDPSSNAPGGPRGPCRDCKWQMSLPCTLPCTLCLIKRELTYQKRKAAGLGAPPAADAIEGR